MNVQNVSNVSFGYSSILKTLWRKGKLPTVKYGFYGDELTQDTLSLEHMEPKSMGGKSELDNYVLASKRMNNARGNKPFAEFFNPESAKRYLLQFSGVKVGIFDGEAYKKMITRTINRLLNGLGIFSI